MIARLGEIFFYGLKTGDSMPSASSGRAPALVEKPPTQASKATFSKTAPPWCKSHHNARISNSSSNECGSHLVAKPREMIPDLRQLIPDLPLVAKPPGRALSTMFPHLARTT